MERIFTNDRDKANVEVERGEVVVGDLNRDGYPETTVAPGKRHEQGGTPANLPNDSFVFSDRREMAIKDPELLKYFGLPQSKKGYTPAQIAKKYDLKKYYDIIDNVKTKNDVRLETAKYMLKSNMLKLSALALIQEGMKGFPQGIPSIAEPFLIEKGINPQVILSNSENVGSVVLGKMAVGGEPKNKDNNKKPTEDNKNVQQPTENKEQNSKPLEYKYPENKPNYPIPYLPGNNQEPPNIDKNKEQNQNNQNNANTQNKEEDVEEQGLIDIKGHPERYKAPFFLQDKINMIAQGLNLLNTRFIAPVKQRVEFKEVQPQYMDANQLARQAVAPISQMASYIGAYASPQAGLATLSNLSAKASDAATKAFATADLQNVNIANTINKYNTDIKNKEAQINTQLQDKFNQESAIARQQFANEISEKTGALAASVIQGLDNRAYAQQLNLMSKYFAIDPTKGGIIKRTSVQPKFEPKAPEKTELERIEEYMKKFTEWGLSKEEALKHALTAVKGEDIHNVYQERAQNERAKTAASVRPNVGSGKKALGGQVDIKKIASLLNSYI